MNTFNKVWIVPESANVFEHNKGAFVVNSHLKVMLEEDYVAMDFHQKSTATPRAPARGMALEHHNQDSEDGRLKMENRSSIQHPSSNLNPQSSQSNEITSGVSSQIVREILIPEIEKEVNTGETFANLRQIFNSMILATWYKQNLKESLLGQIYVDQNKIKGVELKDTSVHQQIYDQYVAAFKKGVFNYIKEDIVAMEPQQGSTATSRASARDDPQTQEIIPRKYFSGGFASSPLPQVVREGTTDELTAASPVNSKNWVKKANVIKVDLTPHGSDAKQLSEIADASSPVFGGPKKRIFSAELARKAGYNTPADLVYKTFRANNVLGVGLLYDEGAKVFKIPKMPFFVLRKQPYDEPISVTDIFNDFELIENPLSDINVGQIVARVGEGLTIHKYKEGKPLKKSI